MTAFQTRADTHSLIGVDTIHGRYAPVKQKHIILSHIIGSAGH
jgi:hypothetical protein